MLKCSEIFNFHTDTLSDAFGGGPYNHYFCIIFVDTQSFNRNE